MTGVPKPWPERFWSKVDRRGSNECWDWLASKVSGYGHISAPDGTFPRAHRVSYELLVGPIPEGLVLDHLCRNPACVNPAHLEPVTHYENTVVRGIGGAASKIRQTHCHRGHAFTPENTYRTPLRQTRSCRACHAAAERQRKANRRAARRAARLAEAA